MTLDLSKLVTEGRLPESANIDQASTLEMLHTINDQDKLVAAAVEREIANIARAVDLIAARLKDGGRLFYIGAGSRDIGARAMATDAVVGIAASGRTPYTVAALRQARRRGCATVAVTNNPASPLAEVAEVAISPIVGPEMIMGSTRMKAGTAQKLVLNMLSTAVMIKLGKVYANLMVDMHSSNAKLRMRAVRMVMLAAEVDEAAATVALDAAASHVETAIVLLRAGVTAAAAQAALAKADGVVRHAIVIANGVGR